MVSEIDIYRAANLLIKQHQDEAYAEAKKRQEVFTIQNDPYGAVLWDKVAEAIIQLQDQRPPTECDTSH